MTAPASKFLDTTSMDWRPFDEAPGVSFRVLKTHRPGTGVTLMLRFDAGAAYPAHRHPEGEEYYVLDGELTDAGKSYGAGTYVYHPPGSVHRPSSGPGATVLVFLTAGIEVV
jgi:quercetin dioxygenase-like cupin family protein